MDKQMSRRMDAQTMLNLKLLHNQIPKYLLYDEYEQESLFSPVFQRYEEKLEFNLHFMFHTSLTLCLLDYHFQLCLSDWSLTQKISTKFHNIVVVSSIEQFVIIFCNNGQIIIQMLEFLFKDKIYWKTKQQRFGIKINSIN